MQKRVYIIHGWDGYPEEAWFPWLKKELERRGIEVAVPQMPQADSPKIDVWIPFLQNLVPRPDADTYFVAHSIGCQATLRYLETLKSDVVVGGVVCVAGWMSLTPIATRTLEDQAIARPWFTTPIDYPTVRAHFKKCIAIFSDNDPFVPVENEATYQEKLGATIVHEHGMGHFNEESNTLELPSALYALLEVAGMQDN